MSRTSSRESTDGVMRTTLLPGRRVSLDSRTSALSLAPVESPYPGTLDVISLPGMDVEPAVTAGWGGSWSISGMLGKPPSPRGAWVGGLSTSFVRTNVAVRWRSQFHYACAYHVVQALPVELSPEALETFAHHGRSQTVLISHVRQPYMLEATFQVRYFHASHSRIFDGIVEHWRAEEEETPETTRGSISLKSRPMPRPVGIYSTQHRVDQLNGAVRFSLKSPHIITTNGHVPDPRLLPECPRETQAELAANWLQSYAGRVEARHGLQRGSPTTPPCDSPWLRGDRAPSSDSPLAG